MSVTETDAPFLTLWDGRKIPRLGMGCWAIGGAWKDAAGSAVHYGRVDDDESVRALRRAYDLGVRFFDTASGYGSGHSEQILGEALGRNEDAVFTTKIGYVPNSATGETGPIEAGPDLPFQVRDAVQASARRLGRERIDLVLLHVNSLSIDVAKDVFDALETLRSEGALGAYGWSTDFPERVAAFAELPHFAAVEHAMNVYFPAPSMIALAEQRGLVSINRSPLAMGLLTGKFRAGEELPKDDLRHSTFEWMDYFKNGQAVPELVDRLEAIRDLLCSDGRSPAQGALAWLWARSPATIPIPGFRTVEQVEHNAAALRFGALSDQVMNEIEQLIPRDPETFRER